MEESDREQEQDEGPRIAPRRPYRRGAHGRGRDGQDKRRQVVGKQYGGVGPQAAHRLRHFHRRRGRDRDRLPDGGLRHRQPRDPARGHRPPGPRPAPSWNAPATSTSPATALRTRFPRTRSASAVPAKVSDAEIGRLSATALSRARSTAPRRPPPEPPSAPDRSGRSSTTSTGNPPARDRVLDRRRRRRRSAGASNTKPRTGVSTSFSSRLSSRGAVERPRRSGGSGRRRAARQARSRRRAAR